MPEGTRAYMPKRTTPIGAPKTASAASQGPTSIPVGTTAALATAASKHPPQRRAGVWGTEQEDEEEQPAGSGKKRKYDQAFERAQLVEK